MEKGKERVQSLTVIATNQGDNQRTMLNILERTKRDVEAGLITRLGVVFEQGSTGEWGTCFSLSTDSRVDAAMLMEIALRKLGFNSSYDGHS